ncbi:cupin domain-containing protein [Flindersiella endophytica]
MSAVNAVNVVNETAERTIRTAAGVMTALAAPSQGSRELATWRTRMEPGAEGPLHAIDREQVWMPVTGSFTVTVDGASRVVAAGEALILPAGAPRQIRANDDPVEVLVCMPAGGKASVPGSPDTLDLPWAE